MKWSWSNAQFILIMFCFPSCFHRTSYWSISMSVYIVLLYLWCDTRSVTLRKTVDCVWEQRWSFDRILWLKVIGNWRKLHNVWLHKLYYTFHQILELRKKGMWMAWSCRQNVTWGMLTGLSEILNHNARSSLLLDRWAKEIRWEGVSSGVVAIVINPRVL